MMLVFPGARRDNRQMLFLFRLLIIGAVFGALGYAALWALGTYVEPERREIRVTIPTPRQEK